MKIRILRIKQALVYATMLTTMVMYIPAFYNSGIYSALRYVLFGLMGLLVYLTFSLKFILSRALTRKTLIVLIIVFLEYLAALAFKLRFRSADVVPFALVLLLVMVGARVHFKDKEFRRLCTVYCFGTLALGLLAILTYLGSFSLASNANDITGKNQVGAIVAVGGGIAFYLSQQPMRRKRRLMYLVLAGMILVILLVQVRWNLKQRRRAILTALVVYIIFVGPINRLVIDSLLKSTDLEDEELVVNSDLINQLSTNRHERNVQAIQFLKVKPIEGALVEYSGIKLIHNYVLLRLVRYGLILGLPYVWIYLVYLLYCIRRVARKDFSLSNMGSYILIIPIGYDRDATRVATLMAGHDATCEVPDELLQTAIREHGFRCTTDLEAIRDCNFYVVAVPTPVDANNHPDLRPLQGASETVGHVIAPGDVVVYESTVYPGVTEEECLPVIERVSGLKFNVDFFAGYSPERINPGDREHTVEKIKKVTSG